MSIPQTSPAETPRPGPKPRLALIAGPTASGKSDCAVRLALRLARGGHQAIVINADSAQVYADLAILSARPTEAEMRGLPHRLFGAWDGAMPCSAAQWAAAARREISAAHRAGAIPILVGGTGLYLRTLLDGIAPVPEIAPEVRQSVRALSTAQAYRELAAEDPARAAILAPADSQRIARALEVVRATGRTLGDWQARREGGIGDAICLAPVILAPGRDWLQARIEARLAAMIAAGALGEVERLLARRLDPALPVMRAIGVPELARVVRGECGLAEAMAAAALATRQYAKRQLTWLRHQTPEDWPRLAPDNFSNPQIEEILLQRFGLT